MSNFQQQMEHIHSDEPKDYTLIFPNDSWELRDYKELFYYIKKGYLVQSGEWDRSINGFEINEEWEWDGYEEEDWEDI
jgi:hypothetical protein